MSDLVNYGWAPGNYNAICTVCKKQHTDTDKRSPCCKECAQDAKIKALEARLNLKLITDVKIYPATVIRAGCTVETVVRSIEVHHAASLLEKKK